MSQTSSAGPARVGITWAEGLWYDGKSAGGAGVRVFYRQHGQELRLCAEKALNDLHPLAVWPLNAVHVLPPPGAGSAAAKDLRLRREPDDGQRLVLSRGPDADMVNGWLGQTLRGRGRATRTRWGLAALSVWLLCGLLYVASPVIFSAIAGLMPRSWEETLGKNARDTMVQALSLMPGGGGVNRAATDDPALAVLMQRLESAAPTGGYAFDLLVVDSAMANAFALPGGYLTVTSALVADCQSPDDLAGVLGHEMAHVTQQHGLARVLREYVWSALLRGATGNESFASGLAGLLVSTSFSRDDEREADRLGAARAAQAGINPLALGDFFTRLEKSSSASEGGLAAYMSTHPASAERSAAIAAAQQGVQGATNAGGRGAKNNAYTPAVPSEDWQRLRRLCAGQSKKADR